MVTWGVFDRSGRSHEATAGIGADELALAFRERVFALLLADDAITPDVVENMRSWPHPGFGVHIGPTTDVPPDRDGRPLAPHGLLSYFVRPAVSLAKLQLMPDGKVLYRADRVHPKHGASSRLFDPLEFLATLAMHIPDVNSRQVSYAGWYSNRSRGRRKMQATQVPAADLGPPLGAAPPDPTPNTGRRLSWARLIQFAWEVDPLQCPRCRGPMRVVAVITDPRIIAKIVDHVERRGPTGCDPPRGRDPGSRELIREPYLDDASPPDLD